MAQISKVCQRQKNTEETPDASELQYQKDL